MSQDIADGLYRPPFTSKVGNRSGINRFISSLRGGGIIQPNRYEVIISPPASVLTLLNQRGAPWDSYAASNLSIRVDSVELPGKVLSTLEHRTTQYFRKMPYQSIYNELDISFILSDNAYERHLLDSWQDVIHNRIQNDINYYENFTSTIQIRILNKSDGVTREVKLYESYPVSVSPIALDYSSNDTFAKQSARFTFYKWEVDGKPGQNFPLILAPLLYKTFANEAASQLADVEEVAIRTASNIRRAEQTGLFD